MRNLIERGICIGLILFAFSILGCAKNIGVDNVPKIANTIQIAAEFVTTQGLTLLKDKKPSELPGALTDLSSITAVADKYADGKASVGDVAFTITEALNRLNARFALIESDQTGLILSTINTLARMVELYFVEASLPDEFGTYVGAFAAGVKDGKTWFMETYPSE